LNTRIIFFLFLGFLLPAANDSAQVLPRAGTHFTFGIPEGADAVLGPSLAVSVLTLNIVSHYDGKGIITSPSGYCQEFSFSSDSATVITLPYSLMHLRDVGKTNKGILIKTSQPVNATFHDFLSDAGEATQIYPDEMLDTDYRITAWGIFDDPADNEDNHSQFIITATQDSTDVTIVPSVLTLGNHKPGIPILTSLNKGECYIFKADSFGVPISISLTNSTVRASKPVSIVTGISCGYVPLGVQSCDEMLDEILPRKITADTFYVAPLLNGFAKNTAYFTSDIANYFVIATNGSNYQSSSGIAEVDITQPEMLISTAPTQCFLLSQGSSVQDEGDPSMVTVLPRSQYIDTMLWYTPFFVGQIQFQPAPFENFVSVIYPQASEGQILLDGTPIASLSAPQAIFGSPMAGAVISIDSGVHLLTSPVPIYATATGFADADGYSFVPGSIGPKLPDDTIPIALSITATDVKTCRTFDATVVASFRAADDVNSANLNITYDPSLLTLIAVNLGPVAQGGQWVTDASVPGEIIITASCLKPFTDSGALATMTFSTGPAATTTPITATISEMGGERIYGALAGSETKKVDVQEIRDTMIAAFAIDAGTSLFTANDTATVRLVSAPSEAVNEIDLFVTYNHDILSLQYADLKNTLIPGLTTIPKISIDQFTDEIRIQLPSPMTFSAPGVIARLVFNTFVSDSTSGSISLRTVIGNLRPCPLDILADITSGEFTGTDTCGYSTLRSVLRNEPFTINSIIPNPSNGSFTINIDRHLFGGEPLHISLFDLLGNEIWTTDYMSGSINQKIPCHVPASVVAGSYFIRASTPGKTETKKIIIRN
jgi:hypothetical protein